MKPLAAVTLILAALFAFAACSSSDGQPNNESGLKQAATKAFEAFVSGDDKTAYNAYTRQCRDKNSYTKFVGTMLVARGFFEGFMKVKASDLKVTAVDTRNVADGKGEARIHIASKNDPGLNLNDDSDKFSAWVYEDGGWRQSDCSDMTMDSSSDTPTAAAKASPPARAATAAPTPTATTIPPARVGQPFDVDGVRITINEIRDPYTPPADSFGKPKAGNRIIAFDITVEGVKAGSSYNPFYFTVQDDQSYAYNSPAFAGPQPTLNSGDLAAGEKIRGWVSLEVPTAAKLTRLVWKRSGTSVTVVDLTKP